MVLKGWPKLRWSSKAVGRQPASSLSSEDPLHSSSSSFGRHRPWPAADRRRASDAAAGFALGLHDGLLQPGRIDPPAAGIRLLRGHGAADHLANRPLLVQQRARRHRVARDRGRAELSRSCPAGARPTAESDRHRGTQRRGRSVGGRAAAWRRWRITERYSSSESTSSRRRQSTLSDPTLAGDGVVVRNRGGDGCDEKEPRRGGGEGWFRGVKHSERHRELAPPPSPAGIAVVGGC